MWPALAPFMAVSSEREARIEDPIEAKFHQVGGDKPNTLYLAAFYFYIFIFLSCSLLKKISFSSYCV